MPKFNLLGLLNNESNMTAVFKPVKIVQVSINDLLPNDKNFYDTQDIEQLKNAIEFAGGVKQNLIIKPADESGKHIVIAGHRRRLACLELVAEGKSAFELVPAVIDESQDEETEELLLILTNSSTRVLSDYEKVVQAKTAKRLLTNIKRRENIPGRVRELVADMLNVTTSQLSRYEKIDKSLCEDLKEEFKQGNISITAAYDAAKLDDSGQQAVLKKVKKDSGVVKPQDIKAVIPDQEVKKKVEPIVKEEPKESFEIAKILVNAVGVNGTNISAWESWVRKFDVKLNRYSL